MKDPRTKRGRLRGSAGHRAFADAEPNNGLAGQLRHPVESPDKAEWPPNMREV